MVDRIEKVLKKDTENIKKVFRKNQDLFTTLEKIKLYTSRTGVLHGIKTIEIKGEMAKITTHCGQTILIRSSKHSRVARWLRNRWLTEPCTQCKIPEWKLEKYSNTRFIKRR